MRSESQAPRRIMRIGGLLCIIQAAFSGALAAWTCPLLREIPLVDEIILSPSHLNFCLKLLREFIWLLLSIVALSELFGAVALLRASKRLECKTWFQLYALSSIIMAITIAGPFIWLATWDSIYGPITVIKNAKRTQWSDSWSTVVFLVGIATLPWLFVLIDWWKRSQATDGVCPSCGYDLTGNQTGVCPECGVALVG